MSGHAKPLLPVLPVRTASMETRDGIRLDADIYQPDAPGPFPVLLMRQPYGRRIASTICYAHPAWYAARGYIVAIQDVRGRGTSAGRFRLFADDIEDGADSVAWAASLPGSSGAVGMYGFSYQGSNQLLAAAGGSPALKALAPAMIGWDTRTDWAYENDAFCLAAGLVRSGRAKRVMSIGFDALVELVFAGFDSLRASTVEKCRPFDSARTGLALGEGAACFLIEALDDVPREAVRASVAGWGFANDNHHLTQPEPSGAGPRLSMQRALSDAGWTEGDVDYINAHGTGTPFNDSSEAAAIRSVCPQAPVSSTKGMTGHALGAAGAIEAAFCILAMEEEFLPPNINLRETDSGLDIVANTARPARPSRVLSNSFGFGGSNATVLLEKLP